MKLNDVLQKTDTEQRCTRCKKVIQGHEYKQIGERCFCLECISAEERILPEYLLLRTPSLLKADRTSAEVLTCPICKKENNNPYFYPYVKNNNSYFHTWIGEQRFCYLCAVKQLPALNNMNDLKKNNLYFFYPVSDKNAENDYWKEAVYQANSERQKSKLSIPESFERVDHIVIEGCCYEDDDALLDDNTYLNIYANAERTLWCFQLINDFVSGWDGWPAYMGGFITPKQFLEFINRMNLKHPLCLFEKAEKHRR